MSIPVSGVRSIAARGGGGRSSFSGVTASVFGATGFLGRYVVNALGRIGSTVVVPYRGDELSARHLKPMGDLGQIIPTPFELRDDDSVRRALSRSTVVVNLIGNLFPTRNYSLSQVHVDCTRRLAEIAREENVPHFVHVSTNIPRKETSSEWLSSKIAGEKAIREVYPDACVIRPTDIFGAEDRFFMRMASHISSRPFLFLAKDGRSMVQPVFVCDVARFVAAAAKDPQSFAGQTLELGGPEVLSIRECYDFVLLSTKRKGRFVPVPTAVARLLAQVEGKRVPFLNSSPMYTLDSSKMETADNILDPSKQGVLRFEDLNCTPIAARSRAGDEILRLFRRGGDRSSLFYID